MAFDDDESIFSSLFLAGDENMIGEHSYKYLTVDEMKSLGDDSMPIDVTHDEKQHGQPQVRKRHTRTVS